VTGQNGANAGRAIFSSEANDADELSGSLQLEAQKAGSNNGSGRPGRPEFRNHGCRVHPVLRIEKIIFKRRIQIGTRPNSCHYFANPAGLRIHIQLRVAGAASGFF